MVARRKAGMTEAQLAEHRASMRRERRQRKRPARVWNAEPVSTSRASVNQSVDVSSVANLVQGPQSPEVIDRILHMEDQVKTLATKEGTHRPPIPGIEIVLLIVERAWQWW